MSAPCDKCGQDVYPMSVGGLCLGCWSEREIDKPNVGRLREVAGDEVADAVARGLTKAKTARYLALEACRELKKIGDHLPNTLADVMPLVTLALEAAAKEGD